MKTYLLKKIIECILKSIYILYSRAVVTFIYCVVV